ncbi:MAG: N-6 DNA methylase, partial [Anaerohalosphaera sp.]|nr:N-6 DNA methylase [Anaerohalosphaera sp.]
RASGAYYTPLHLAELTVDIALESIEDSVGKPIHELKVLDPACGSGVFLVCMFGRMANSLRREKKYAEDDCSIERVRDLMPLLSKMYGIDVNHTACHITCFSLYLALLEQLSPMDVEYLREINDNNKALIPLLANAKGSFNTIHHGNLFDQELSLKEKDFDLVIGNPPWVGSPNQKDFEFLKWRNSKGKRCANILAPNNQIAHGFMWKAPEYLSNEGVACLLLPTSVLLNDGTNKFQKEWLQSVTIERVTNFSDLRYVLFANAIHPCSAIRFRPSSPNSNCAIVYESPKTDYRSQQGGPVYLREEDISLLRLKDILDASINGKAPLIWKSCYWGSWRDQRLLSRLTDYSNVSDLTGEIRQPAGRWNKTTGVVIGNKKHKGWWDNETLYLNSRQYFSVAISPSECNTVAKEIFSLKAEAPRDEALFTGPKVLVTEGAQNMKVGYCGFTMVSKKSIYIINGPQEDENLLRFLSAVIQSDI